MSDIVGAVGTEVSTDEELTSHFADTDGLLDFEPVDALVREASTLAAIAGSLGPVIGGCYRARDLPAGAVAVPPDAADDEYVRCHVGDCLMRWEQPIPGSGDWLMIYAAQLPAGQRMTAREIREVEPYQRAHDARLEEHTPCR